MSGFAFLAALAVLWELAGRGGWVHRLFFPPLSRILAAFWDGLISGEIPGHVGVSPWRGALGYALAGVVAITLGVVMGYWRRAWEAGGSGATILAKVVLPAASPFIASSTRLTKGARSSSGRCRPRRMTRSAACLRGSPYGCSVCSNAAASIQGRIPLGPRAGARVWRLADRAPPFAMSLDMSHAEACSLASWSGPLLRPAGPLRDANSLTRRCPRCIRGWSRWQSGSSTTPATASRG